MKKLATRDIWALGFMAFALFVGAGNIIFPPMIGLQAGEMLPLATLGFLLTAVGLPILTLVALAHIGGELATLSSPIGKTASLILAIVCYLSIGPLFAGPRTATVSFAIGIEPLVSDPQIPLLIYSFIYFAIVTVVAFYPTKLLDSVGHILGPIKILSLALLGLMAFVFPTGPSGPAIEIYQHSAFTQGFVNGYLTMDTLASLAFGIIIVNAVRSRGITSPTMITRYVIIAGLIAGCGLVLIYISLFKLGSNSFNLIPNATNGAEILRAFVHHTFGQWGTFFLAALMGIACIVTAIGVTTACATFFAEQLPKIPYAVILLSLTTFSFAVANFGLTSLIKFSIPVLVAIYPPCIALVVLSFFKRLWQDPRIVYIPTVATALFFGIIDGITTFRGFEVSLPLWAQNLPPLKMVIALFKRINIEPLMALVAKLPLAAESLAWLLPTFGLVIVMTLMERLWCITRPTQI